MRAPTSLLTALRSFRPRENVDPLENFITEAFTWLLRNHVGFGRYFLRKITDELGVLPVSESVALNWSTRLNLGGLFPDLVCETGAKVFIFEHKAWSPLHESQLAQYRHRAQLKYGADGYHLILITGASHLVDQNPDCSFLWNNIYSWTLEWEQNKYYEPEFLFADFRLLLETEGMGPPAPISHESIFAFRPAQGFETKVSDLIRRAYKYPWADLLPKGVIKLELPKSHGGHWGDDNWGRFGFHLMGAKAWNPGLFVGFLLDPRDHKVEPLNPACPDFSIILDINKETVPEYDALGTYQKMCGDLSAAVNGYAPEFEVHDHLAAHADPNRWHPIHIRMPMIELLRGTISGADQEKRFIEATSKILRIISTCEAFWEFRDELARISNPLNPPSLPILL